MCWGFQHKGFLLCNMLYCANNEKLRFLCVNEHRAFVNIGLRQLSDFKTTTMI